MGEILGAAIAPLFSSTGLVELPWSLAGCLPPALSIFFPLDVLKK